MFGINERTDATEFLRFSNNMLGQSSFTTTLRTKDLDNTTTG